MNLNDDAIEAPKRTEILINAAKIVGYDPTELPGLVIDSFEEQIPEGIFPFYSVMPDRDDADPRAFMIYMIHTLTGGDDDHDDLCHDLSHALEDLEYCDEHPDTCAICCDEH